MPQYDKWDRCVPGFRPQEWEDPTPSWKIGLSASVHGGGLNDVAGMKDAIVFHAGTAKKDNDVVTAGGRVLGVTALGDSIRDAIDRAYEAVKKISFDGAYYRKDIGYRALDR